MIKKALIQALVTGAGLGLGDNEGIGDALVDGISLPVDAVGVALQQDRDAVPIGVGGPLLVLVRLSKQPLRLRCPASSADGFGPGRRPGRRRLAAGRRMRLIEGGEEALGRVLYALPVTGGEQVEQQPADCRDHQRGRARRGRWVGAWSLRAGQVAHRD
jgi:hypothetical protein